MEFNKDHDFPRYNRWIQHFDFTIGIPGLAGVAGGGLAAASSAAASQLAAAQPPDQDTKMLYSFVLCIIKH